MRSRLPLRIHVEQVDEEIIRQRSGPVGEDAVFGLAGVRVQGAQAADQNRHLRGSQRQQLRPIDEQFFSRYGVSVAEIVAEPVGDRLQRREGVRIGLLLRSIRASGRERNLQVVAGLLRSFLDGRVAAENDQVGQRDFLPTGAAKR